MIGLETSLALGITNLVKKGYLTLEELLTKMTVNPAKLYKMDKGCIEAGKIADLVIFNPAPGISFCSGCCHGIRSILFILFFKRTTGVIVR